jgi:DNA-binding PadR family transcriptional regulator
MITLGYALLGLLARQSRSGYDLIQSMENPVGFFWHARRSQIYPELARLEEAGLVTHELVEQWDRPDKKVYTITETGLAALREWMTAPMARAPDRDEFTLKAFSVWVSDPTAAAPLFRTHEQLHRERQAIYEQTVREMEERWGRAELLRLDSPRFASYATLRRGIDYERSYAEWCHWMVEMLEGQHAKEGDES